MKFVQVKTENGRQVFINPEHVVTIHANGSYASITFSDGTGFVVMHKPENLAFVMASAEDRSVNNMLGKIG
jgi:uncharacterized protein YlzI (FlbEa/FlbD family)